MRVLFLTNIPSPYRVNFFNELGKYCSLTVLFERGFSTERDDSWRTQKFENFSGHILKGIKIGTDKAVSPGVIGHLTRARYDVIVVGNPLTPTGMLAIQYMKVRGISYCIESDGGFAKSGKGVKEKIKKHIFANAAAYMSTSDIHDSYYEMYGADKKRIYRYPFTSISEADVSETPSSEQEKTAIKDELGIKENKVILSVGQFIYRKGFDILIKACRGLDSNIGIYIIGGQATREYTDLVEEYRLSNIHFLNFKVSEKLAKYYRAADLFVLPTREDVWGLVINEAMSKGLPVISSNRCIAAAELVKNEENGYLVESEDTDDFAGKIRLVINDAKLMRKMSEKSLEIIRNYTMEAMAKRHMEIFKEVIS